jgi:hypothetical protein
MPVIEGTLIKTFLKDFEASAIDVDTYGRREKKRFMTRSLSREISLTILTASHGIK